MARKKRRRSRSNDKIYVWIIAVAVVIAGIKFVLDWASANPFQAVLILILLLAALAGAAFLKFPRVRVWTSAIFRKLSPVKDEEVRSLIEIIEGIKIQDVRNEEDFEKQLFQRLDAKDYKVKRQVYYGKNNIVDLVVNGRIGVELKVADRAKNIRDLIGQITVYKKHLEKIVVGILDCGAVSHSDIEEYVSLIKKIDEENVHVVMVKGKLKRHKKKHEYVMVKKTTS